MYKIIIYQDKNGRSEIEEYIKGLSIKEDKASKIKYSKIIAYIRLLRDRILFAYCKDKEFVLLSVFMKKTQKTPLKEITKAKKLLKEFKKRRGNNE